MARSGGSGGGSVGGGGFSGGFGGGFHSGGFGHAHLINGPRYSSSGGSNNGNNGNTENPLYKIGFYLVIGIIALCVFAIPENTLSDYDYYDDYEIVSTVPSYEEEPDSYIINEKSPLDAEYCTPTGVYVTDATDSKEYDGITDNLVSSLRAFYKLTGIEAHVYLLDYYYDGDLYEIAFDKYYELFDDEGHVLLALACDSFDYEYELIVGDEVWNQFSDELDLFNIAIEEKMFDAEYGSYDEIADGLAEAFDEIGESVMYDYVYIGDDITDGDYSEEYVPEDDSEDESEDEFGDEQVSEVPETTEKDAFEEFIENEFGSHETTDTIDLIFEKIESYMEDVSVSAVLTILAIVIVFSVAIIAVIIISRKRNRYEPDTYGRNAFDDYDKKFGRKDSKYDDFLK